MGLFDGARAAIVGRRAYQTHVSANKLADEGKPQAAKAKYDDALRLYDEAEKLGLSDFSMQMGHVVLLQREGQFDRARDKLLSLSKRKDLKDENWFSLRFQYAINQWKRGEIDKAIETIGRAAAYNENGLIFGTLGMLLVEQARQTGDCEAAMAYAQKGLDYDDEDASVLDNMGQLYELMAESAEGDQAEAYRSKAIEYYEKAHEQRPRQITTIYYLARLYHRRGDNDRARKLMAKRSTLYVSKLCPITAEMLDDLAKEIG